jgi:hypothetical protein
MYSSGSVAEIAVGRPALQLLNLGPTSNFVNRLFDPSKAVVAQGTPHGRCPIWGIRDRCRGSYYQLMSASLRKRPNFESARNDAQGQFRKWPQISSEACHG